MIVVNKAEIERLMAQKGIRIRGLKEYGISYPGYMGLISNNPEANLNTVGKLCKALGCQPCDILMRVKDA